MGRSPLSRATARRIPASDAASLSIADSKVEVLTTSGTAGLPAISPDGNYVVYVENGGGRDSLRLRQVATGSNVELVPAEPGVFCSAPPLPRTAPS